MQCQAVSGNPRIRGISSCRTDVHLAHIRRCLSELKQYSAAREAGFAEPTFLKFSTQKAGWAQSAEQVVSVKAGNSEASMEHAAKASQAADSAEEPTTESKETEETPQGQSSGSKTIFAANLSLPICKKDVVKFFEAVAEVTDVRFSSDMNGTFLGYCHVDFATAEAAKKAVKLNGKNFLGRPILIGFAREWGDVSSVQQSNQKPESLVRRFANSDTVVSMGLVTLTRDVGWLGVGALKWALEMYSGETEQAAETGENLVKEVKELKEMLAKVLENQGELLSRRKSWLPWR